MLRKNRQQSNDAAVKVASVRTDFWAQNPRAAALASKLTRDRMHETGTPGQGVSVSSETIFSELLQQRARKNLDAKTIMELQPDIRLIRFMIQSVIMSPLDMDAGGFTHSVGDTDLPGAITNPLLDIVREHFTTYIDLDKEFTRMNPEALFDEGAAVRVIIPESVIDDMINHTGQYTTEQYQNTILDDDRRTFRPVGILGDVMTMEQAKARQESPRPFGSAKVSMESAFHIDVGVTSTRINDMASITDNISVLKMPILKDSIRRSAITDLVRSSVRTNVNRAALNRYAREDYVHRSGDSKVSDIRRLRETLYNSNGGRIQGQRQIAIIGSAQDASRSSIGHPTVQTWRTSSLIPAFSPGNPDEHLGYIGALDSNGYAIDLVAEMQNNVNKGMGAIDNTNAMNLTSTLLQQTQILNSGYNYDKAKQSNSERIRLWQQIYEENILNRIKNGMTGANVQLGKNETFYNMIMARNFANECVHLVYIPASQVVYHAYEYDDNGMGVSLLDGVTQTSTLRIMTNFANFMASVNNAVGRTKVSINIDPRSPDPEKDSTVLMDEYLRTQAGATPTDVTSASEMFRTLRQMGVCFEIQGHSGLPNTTVDVESFQSGKLQIDNEFTEKLRNEQYMGLFVTPDMVDMTQQGDFAITRWTSNQLFTKRIMLLQRITEQSAKRYVTIYCNSSGELINRMQAAIRQVEEKLPEFYRNRTASEEHIQYDSVLKEFFRAYEVKLPSPNNTQADTAKDQIEKESQKWDAVLPYYLANELYDPALGDEQQSMISSLTASMKALLMRRYIEEHDLAPDIRDFVRKDTEDAPALNLMKETMLYWTNLIGNIGDFTAATKARREKRMEYIETANPKLAEFLRNGAAAATTDDNPDDNNNNGNVDDIDFNADLPNENANNDDNANFNSPSTPFDGEQTGNNNAEGGGDDTAGAPAEPGDSNASGSQPPEPQNP